MLRLSVPKSFPPLSLDAVSARPREAFTVLYYHGDATSAIIGLDSTTGQ